MAETLDKVVQDILRCKAIIQDISISHYDQTRYRQLVDEIFYEIFKDTFRHQIPAKTILKENKTGSEICCTDKKCPDKLEPND